MPNRGLNALRIVNPGKKMPAQGGQGKTAPDGKLTVEIDAHAMPCRAVRT